MKSFLTSNKIFFTKNENFALPLFKQKVEKKYFDEKFQSIPKKTIQLIPVNSFQRLIFQ